MKSIRWKAYLSLKWSMLLACLLLLAACDQRVVYHHYEILPASQWQRQDTLYFTPSITDSETVYQADIEIRLLHPYPYRQVDLGYLYFGENKTLLERGTCQISTTDQYEDKNGEGIAGVYSYSVQVKPLRINKSGEYFIRIFPLTTDSILIGIQDVGIKLSY